MGRVLNFSAGPALLPEGVLAEAQAELVDYAGTGMSLVEMSHRSASYEGVHTAALDLVREIFAVPDGFSVLLLQGGATLQFSMVPMNLLAGGGRGGYVASGAWAAKAIADGSHHGDVYVAWRRPEEGPARMPAADEVPVQAGTRYLHVTSNETIDGLQMFAWPETDVPLVADMSSDLLSRPVPWDRFDLVYGGAQKNVGPAGATVVVIRDAVLDDLTPKAGAYLRYETHRRSGSLYNTPPVFTVHVLGKVLRWVRDEGGLTEMESRARRRSGLVYEAMAASDGFYRCPVDAASRSLMNVVFRLPSEDLETRFLAEAEAEGLVGLRGHRSVGGCRASLYNAMPVSGAETLASFMDAFRRTA